jgi:hypothetical protein
VTERGRAPSGGAAQTELGQQAKRAAELQAALEKERQARTGAARQQQEVIEKLTAKLGATVDQVPHDTSCTIGFYHWYEALMLGATADQMAARHMAADDATRQQGQLQEQAAGLAKQLAEEAGRRGARGGAGRGGRAAGEPQAVVPDGRAEALQQEKQWTEAGVGVAAAEAEAAAETMAALRAARHEANQETAEQSQQVRARAEQL